MVGILSERPENHLISVGEPESDIRGLTYQVGLGNELESEALVGTLPPGQNDPQRPAHGLVSELISGTTFSAARAFNRRTWAFRVRPSVVHGAFSEVGGGAFVTPPFGTPISPNQLRWSPLPIPEQPQDFVQGMTTVCGNGSPLQQSGMSFHIYLATESMAGRYFANADGELLVLPEQGSLLISTELGRLHVAPTELALIPRGVKFRVELVDGPARGYVCENYGLPFRLPELGLIGGSGLANPIDFQIPDAWYEVRNEPGTLVQKFAGSFWEAELDHSPLDVVAWRGNLLPAKFDMSKFMALGSVTVDHPDPSIFCALTSPGDAVLGGNADFLVVPPRWNVADGTFRPAGFHRNCVAEIFGLISGQRETNSRGMPPGGFTLHNNWVAHGPDVESFEAARVADLPPAKVESLAIMFESRMPMAATAQAMESTARQSDYQRVWQGFRPRFEA